MMEYRRYPHTDEQVSLLGFGCMRLPLSSEQSGDIDVKRAEEMIDRAYARGVNYFDTAYPYHEGRSELFLGKALKKYPRESFLLANKLPIWEIGGEEDVHRIFDEQLEKCQVEYFDYYLVHSLWAKRVEVMERHRVYELLRQKKAKGRIRHLGFSFHARPDLLEQILGLHEWDFVQLQINYLDWELQDAKRQYQLAEAAGLPVVVMEPVRGGMLATLSPEAAAIYKQADPQASVASWAVRYAASLPNVLTVLSGMSAMDQLEDNLSTVHDFRPLSAGERDVVNRAVEAFRRSAALPCTACRYCMDCPSGVDIPRVFSIYNAYCVNHMAGPFTTSMSLLTREQRPGACVGCGVCAAKCPQSIDIPARMSEIAALAERLK